MSKVDLEQMRKLDEIASIGLKIWSTAHRAIGSQGMFCNMCGETDPEGGFFPLGIGGPGRVSPVDCNPCRRGTDQDATE